MEADRIIQVGFYVWLDGSGGLTTSLRHAHGFDTEAEAETARAWVTANYERAVNGLPDKPRTLRAYYLEKRPAPQVVSRADEQVKLEGLDAAARAANAKAATPVAGPAEPRPIAPRAPRQGGGVTRQVYQWTLDHPEATKADALAAFPDANPSTVGVQFGAARKAAQS